MQGTQVQSLGQEDPPEKEMANHSIILAWKIPWTENSGKLQPMGWQKAGYNWATNTHTQTHTHTHTVVQDDTFVGTRWRVTGDFPLVLFVMAYQSATYNLPKPAGPWLSHDLTFKKKKNWLHHTACGWDLGSLIRDGTSTPWLEAWSLNHLTAKEVPNLTFSLPPLYVPSLQIFILNQDHKTHEKCADKSRTPMESRAKGKKWRSKSKISQWMNGSGRVGPSKSTGCPHQLCILKDYSGPGLSLLVKGGHEHRSGCPWEESAEALMARTTVMEEEYRCRYSPGKQW